MFGTGLIVFRETLEAALFVGIVAASTRGVIDRSRWLSFGVAAGAFGSVLTASAMGRISSWADGIGQDIVSLCILVIALCMLAWHCIWVSPNSSQMVQDAKQIGASTSKGNQTLWALAIAVALSVLREGAETVLFVSGLITGSSESLGAIILMLAGSLASQLAKTANQADWISLFGEQAWDISALLPNNSAIGMVLHGVIGFDASPTQLQVLFYLGATSLIWIAARQVKLLISQRRNALITKI
jgi:high-affinity iron transporter